MDKAKTLPLREKDFSASRAIFSKKCSSLRSECEHILCWQIENSLKQMSLSSPLHPAFGEVVKLRGDVTLSMSSPTPFCIFFEFFFTAKLREKRYRKRFRGYS
ncbi:MAG TPA: hypothetical protein PLG20_01290 [Candidatus Syntrophosphaera sp.]|nr:hypothetical protein [Candidatus Syntrophosphaera sp.]